MHIAIAVCLFSTIVINEPDDVTICEGEEAVFTCVLNTTTNSSIDSSDLQWYKNTGTAEMVDQQGSNIHFTTSAVNNTLTSRLTITNANKLHTGYYWVGMPSFNVCNVSLTVLASMYVMYIYDRNFSRKYIQGGKLRISKI